MISRVFCILFLLLVIGNAQRSSSGGRSSSSSSGSRSSSTTTTSSYYYGGYYGGYVAVIGYYGGCCYYASGAYMDTGALSGIIVGSIFACIICTCLVCMIMVYMRSGVCSLCCWRHWSKTQTIRRTEFTTSPVELEEGSFDSNDDGPRRGGGLWGTAPTTLDARTRFVVGDPAEQCVGPSRVFAPGVWTGHFVEFGNISYMAVTLQFADGQITGSGSDGIGAFTFSGAYRDSTKRAALLKNYDSHCVEYRGTFRDGKLSGDWSMLDNPQGTFLASDTFVLSPASPLPASPPPATPVPSYGEAPPVYTDPREQLKAMQRPAAAKAAPAAPPPYQSSSD